MQGLRDLEANTPDLYARACQMAAQHGLTVAHFIGQAVSAEHDAIKQQVELDLHELREFSPYGFDPLILKP